MNEQKKDAALDEATLEDVTGGGLPTWVSGAWTRVLESEGANDNKEQQQ